VALISHDISLGRGESASLACVGVGETGLEISWSFNGAPVGNTTLVAIHEEVIGQDGKVFVQSFLQICSLAESDAGNYTCVASDDFTSANATIQLTVLSKLFLKVAGYRGGKYSCFSAYLFQRDVSYQDLSGLARK
jgi:hypothetical protein